MKNMSLFSNVRQEFDWVFRNKKVVFEDSSKFDIVWLLVFLETNGDVKENQSIEQKR